MQFEINVNYGIGKRILNTTYLIKKIKNKRLSEGINGQAEFVGPSLSRLNELG